MAPYEPHRKTIKPIYKRLLWAALAVYVIGNSYIQADLYRRVGDIRHYLAHEEGHGH